MLTIITGLAIKINVTIVSDMCDYSFLADALNKYSQFTPAIQAVIAVSFCGMLSGFAYFIKECVVAVMRPFSRHSHNSSQIEDKNCEFKGKHYREPA